MTEANRHKTDRFVIDETLSIKDAIQTIQQNSSRCAIVVNGSGKVVGIFSEGDVLRALLNETSIYTSLKSVITPSFLYLHSADKSEALRVFKKYGISLIPIVNESFELVDVITLLDLLNQLELPKE